ncbi:MAG: hypothetical protein IJD97_05895 [Clostridia bacterium]|nr:hypothetical protein [Clostridia bacterium]
MKKTFYSYIVIWAILLALFNVIVFVSPSEAGSFSKFGGAFWSGYVFITLAFVGQLTVSFFAFKAENLEKFFYKLPLVRISYTGLVLTLIFSALCMAIPNLPNWVGIILCFIILALSAISVVKANLAGDAVAAVDEKIKTQTFFIKSLTVDANTLMAKAKTEEAKAECKKVYEAIRYSDPMSSDALSSAEASITLKFNEFSEAVENGVDEKIAELSKEVMILIEDRNKKCKLLK